MAAARWKSISLAVLLASMVMPWTLSQAMAASDVLVLARPEDPPTADPGVEMTNNGYNLIYAAYQRLVAYKGGSTDIVPELAESWTVDDSGLVWSFKLARGHQFDDGSPVDAAAVKFSFDRALKLNAGPADAFLVLQEIEVVDPLTVKFHLSAPFAPFLSTLACAGGSIINPKAMAHEKDGDMAKGWLAEHSAGSGAYRISGWERNQSITLDLNEHFGGPSPALKRIVVRAIGEISTRRLQLINGDADIIEQIPFDQIEALRQNPALVIESNPSMNVGYISINNKKPPLDDARVRQAISYAVDYQGIVDGILQGQAKQMRGPVPSGMWGHDANGFQYHYDIQKAKALLAEAGKTNIRLTYLFSQGDIVWEPVGLALQASLADIGIKLDLQSVANVARREQVVAGKYDLSPGSWTPDFADPYMFMNYWLDPDRSGGPGKRAFYHNPKVTQMVREAASLTDRPQREKLYIEAQKLAALDAPFLYLVERNDVFARRASVKGYVYNPMLLQIYNFATMSKSE